MRLSPEAVLLVVGSVRLCHLVDAIFLALIDSLVHDVVVEGEWCNNVVAI